MAGTSFGHVQPGPQQTTSATATKQATPLVHAERRRVARADRANSLEAATTPALPLGPSYAPYRCKCPDEAVNMVLLPNGSSANGQHGVTVWFQSATVDGFMFFGQHGKELTSKS